MERGQRPVISATSSFPPNLKVPVGASGVIKCSIIGQLDHVRALNRWTRFVRNGTYKTRANQEGNWDQLGRDRVELFTSKHTHIVRAQAVLLVAALYAKCDFDQTGSCYSVRRRHDRVSVVELLQAKALAHFAIVGKIIGTISFF